MNQYLVYILKCDNLTYVGMTNDFFKRWQQHNQILSGGAKYTKKGCEWYPICIIDGFQTKSEAMQCEWKIKSRRSKLARKFRGGKGKSADNRISIFKYSIKTREMDK